MQALSDMVLALRYEKVTARTNGLLFKKFKDAIEKQKARASKGVEYPAEALEKRSVRPIGRYAPQSANDCLEEVLQAVGGAR